MKKIHRQDARPVSAPEMTEPSVPPSPAMPPQTPRAFIRSRESGNSTGIMPSAAGAASASPVPCTNRLETSIDEETAAPLAADADPEDEHADQEQPPPAEQVRQPPAQEQQSAGHQHVTVDHPGQARAGERQIVLDPRQGDGHHGDVQDEHELDQRQHAKRPPSPRVRTGGPDAEPCGSWLAMFMNRASLSPPPGAGGQYVDT